MMIFYGQSMNSQFKGIHLMLLTHVCVADLQIDVFIKKIDATHGPEDAAK